MRWWSWSALVLGAWLVFVASAVGFAQVPGSPFATGVDAGALAFSPGGGLIAATNVGASSVSVFAVDPSTGALSAVAGSPFSTGPESGPSSLAFSPRGRLLATANFGAGSVSVFSVNPSTG